MKRLIFIIVIILLIPAPVLAQPLSDKTVIIGEGFFKGNKYLEQVDLVKKAYITGLIDGLMAGQFIQTDEDLHWLNNCVKGMQNQQVQAIVDKYLKNNPKELHTSMNGITYRAIFKICPKHK